MKNIYIILSQTPSIVARIIRRVTGDKYSHSAIALDEDLSAHYTFGRIYPWCALIGGFVRETPGKGTLWRFRKAEMAVLKVGVTDEQYAGIKAYIAEMYENRKKYHYNYRGLFLARKGKKLNRPYHYYCSEFVVDVLERFGVIEKGQLGKTVRPVELLNFPGAQMIYNGRICDYRCRKAKGYEKFSRGRAQRGNGRTAANRSSKYALCRPRMVVAARGALKG